MSDTAKTHATSRTEVKTHQARPYLTNHPTGRNWPGFHVPETFTGRNIRVNYRTV